MLQIQSLNNFRAASLAVVCAVHDKRYPEALHKIVQQQQMEAQYTIVESAPTYVTSSSYQDALQVQPFAPPPSPSNPTSNPSVTPQNKCCGVRLQVPSSAYWAAVWPHAFAPPPSLWYPPPPNNTCCGSGCRCRHQLTGHLCGCPPPPPQQHPQKPPQHKCRGVRLQVLPSA